MSGEREKEQAYQKAWRDAHPNYHQDYEASRKYWKQWRAAHPNYMKDWWKSEPTAKITEAEWSERRRIRNHLKWHKRRALKAKATINLAGIKEFVRRVKAKKHIHCYYCDRLIPTLGCHFDHIIPLSKGGPHSADNLCVCCNSCNSSKNNKPLSVWINTRSGQQLLNL